MAKPTIAYHGDTALHLAQSGAAILSDILGEAVQVAEISDLKVAPDETADLADAIAEFEAALPGWWYSVCKCSVSCDASCGPDRQWADKDLLAIPQFDEGFHADLAQPSTCAEALREVMRQGLAARAEALGGVFELGGGGRVITTGKKYPKLID